jgi:hypothetical protein
LQKYISKQTAPARRVCGTGTGLICVIEEAGASALKIQWLIANKDIFHFGLRILSTLLGGYIHLGLIMYIEETVLMNVNCHKKRPAVFPFGQTDPLKKS